GGERQGKAREVVGEDVVLAPPGIVLAEGLREVVLAAADESGEAEVLVHEVDAVGVLPVAEALHVFKTKLPAGAAIGFAEGAAAAHLRGHGGQLAGGAG